MNLKMLYRLMNICSIIALILLGAAIYTRWMVFFLAAAVFILILFIAWLWKYRCPHCRKRLPQKFDLTEKAICPSCGKLLQ